MNRADIDRLWFLSSFRVGGVLSHIDTNNHTVDTVLTSDESLWVKAGPRPVSQRRDRQQEKEEDSQREMIGNNVLPTPSFLLHSASLLAQVMGSGQASSHRGQSSPKVWTNIERCGDRKGFGGLKHWKENPGQGATPALPGSRIQCQTSPVGSLCRSLCPGRLGSSGLCPKQSYACKLKTKMRI